MVGILMVSLAHTQKISTDKVPDIVKQALKSAHPGATATWEMEDANYEANFKEQGKEMSCLIDRQGTILETEAAIAASELPAAATTFIDQHYKGKKWKEVTRIVKASGEVNYEVDVEGTDVLFDGNGNHLQKPKEKEEED